VAGIAPPVVDQPRKQLARRQVDVLGKEAKEQADQIM